MQQDELRERMERLAPTFACWDLLEFAAMTRPAAVSLEQIARQIGRSPDDTRPALDHLVACRVFRETDSGDGRYEFDPPADATADIKTLFDALAEGSGRLWAVTAVLQLDARSGSADEDPPTGVC
jgi:hypothetical protein